MKNEPNANQESAESPQAAAPADNPAPAEAAAPAPETVNVQELKTQAAKAQEHYERLLRTTADFDNFKKRAAREKQEAIKFANEALLQKLIPVLDNFDMAMTATNTASGDAVQSLRSGLTMIQSQFKSVLGEAGLEEIDATQKPFDPNFHEAVSQQETADVPEGHVAMQLRKGYKLKDRLLRPATVIVAKPPAA